MYKFIGSCVFLALFFVYESVQCYAGPDYDANQEYSGEAFEEATKRTLAESCRSPGTKDEDIEAFVNEDPNPSYETKCIHACVLKKFDIITETGEFNVKGMKEMYEFMASDEDELKLRLGVIESCSNIEEDDECNLPDKIMSCLREKGEDIGIEEW